jgi:hypothetical protein
MVVLSGPKVKLNLITLSRTLKYAWAKALEMSDSLIKEHSVA